MKGQSAQIGFKTVHDAGWRNIHVEANPEPGVATAGLQLGARGGEAVPDRKTQESCRRNNGSKVQ